MSKTVNITINGRELKVEVGSTILRAAQNANIDIPNLCDNEEVKPYGSCRLCMVEITHKNRKRLVTSCIYEVSDGLKVETETEKVSNVRRMVIELLLTRNPSNPVLVKIAENLGVDKSRFKCHPVGCILCGLCVRVCREVVGVSAIGFKGRGITRKVTTPFDEAPRDCIACGSCAYVCPVNAIPLKDKGGMRNIWNTDFPIQQCSRCGRDIAPVIQLEYFQQKYNLPNNHFDICNHCRE